MSNTVYEVVTERILAEMEKGVVPWRVPWLTGSPRSLSTGNDYRGFNSLLLGMLGREHSTPFWTTFNQASEMGGVIKKGSKSVPITFWTEIKKKDGEEKDDKPRMMCRYYRVFNADQVDWKEGEPKMVRDWRESNKSKKALGEEEQVEAAEKIIAEMPDAPKISREGSIAYYTPANDAVTVPPRENFSTTAGFYSTLFHEVAHATGHPKRLHRFEVDASPSKEAYSKEELVAELSACFLCQTSGITPEYQQSASYISAWASKIREDPKIILSSAAAAQRATEHVIGISPEKARAQEQTPDQEIVPRVTAEISRPQVTETLAGKNEIKERPAPALVRSR